MAGEETFNTPLLPRSISPAVEDDSKSLVQLRGQVMNDRDQGDLGSNRQGRTESGSALSGEVLDKRRREVLFFRLGRVGLTTVGRGHFDPSLN